MNALFKNKSVLSKENYLILLQFHQKKNNWKYWLYTAVFSILFVVAISFQITIKNYLLALLIFLFFFTFLAYRFIEPFHKAKKEIQSDKVQNNLVNYFFFYDKYFRIKNDFGNYKLRYYKLYKVYENDNFFYLYIDKTNAFILEKSGFSVGSSKSFEKFIKSKIWLKYKDEK